MFTDELINKELEPIFRTYSSLEEELIQLIVKHIINDSTESGNFEWYTKKLLELGSFNQEVLHKISQASKKSYDEIEEAFYNIGYGSVIDDEKAYMEAYEKGYLGTKPSNLFMSPTLKNIFLTELNNAYDKMNLTNTTAIESSSQKFLDVVNKVYVDVDSGIYDYNSALRRAMRDLSKSGIYGAKYAQPDGRIIRYPLDSAVRRNLFTSCAKTANEMQFARADEWGSELVEISSHMGARPNCAPYQGRIYSLTRENTHYSYFYNTSYGEADGIMGINCGHSVYPFFDGLSVQRYFPYDEKENEKAYKESQKQRRLEVQIRNTKRSLILSDMMDDKLLFNRLSAQLKQQEGKLNKFKNETGRTQQSRTLIEA